MMPFMEQEILEQPIVLSKISNTNLNVIMEISKIIKKNKITNIIAAARGSSSNACVYFKYLCEIYCGINVSFAAPSVTTIYGAQLKFKNCLVLGVSQSGKAKDCIEVLNAANKQNCVTVAVTNDCLSEMAREAKYHLFLDTGLEKSVAATKTFTAQMYLLANLAAGICGNKDLTQNLKKVSSLVNDVIGLNKKILDLSKKFIDIKDLYVLARGINYAACLETALKIQETSYVKAKGFAISDFYHGPMAVLDENSNVLLIAPSGKTYIDAENIAAKIKKTNSYLTVFSDNAKLCKLSDAYILLPKCEECISPFVYVTCAQLFCLYLSLLKKIDPDHPRLLQKITITI